MAYDDEIRNRIKFLRKSLDLSQKQFGERIYLSQDAISSLETGKNMVNDRLIALICNEFNVNKKWIQTGSGKMSRVKNIKKKEEIKSLINDLYTLEPTDIDLIKTLIKRFKKS